MRTRTTSKFNAIIEGAYPEELRNTRWKLVNIAVPPDAGTILARRERFVHHSAANKTGLTPIKNKGSAHRLEDIARMPGIICPALDDVRYKPERYQPRAICLKDGRVYINKRLLQDSAYMGENLPALVSMAKEVFWSRTIMHIDSYTPVDSTI